MIASGDKDLLYGEAVARAKRFCDINSVPFPAIRRLARTDRLFHLATCAYYRPNIGISIMVVKCATRGLGGRAWSWPAYVIDRTPFGVIQHELGHHVDHTRSDAAKSRDDVQSLFSWKMWNASREAPLTGYLGTDTQAPTFFMEWFAENFRLFVTNPDLIRCLRPRFFEAITAHLKPLLSHDWKGQLRSHGAPDRIIEQATKKVAAVKDREAVLL